MNYIYITRLIKKPTKTKVQEYIDSMSIDPKYDLKTQRFLNEAQWKRDKEFDDRLAKMKELFKDKSIGGIDLHAPGAKEDNDKPDLDLVLGDFSRALIEVGKVGAFGAKKYSEHGWLQVPNGIRRYSAALWRHFLMEYTGETVDRESKLLHKAHLAWNSLAALELTLRERS
jgi:hypothetical protein